MNPSYFVGFSTSTIIASTILFHGLNTTGGSNTISLLCGLYIISLGVYLLVRRTPTTLLPLLTLDPQNISRSENEGMTDRPNRHSLLDPGIGPRLSLSTRLSMGSNEDEERAVRGSSRDVRRSPALFEYDDEGVQLERLEEDDEEESADERRGLVSPGRAPART